MQQHREDIMRCKSRMMGLGKALKKYADDHQRRYPESLEQLVRDGYAQRAGLTANDFICPGSHDHISASEAAQWGGHQLSHSSYIYIGKGLTEDSPSETALLYEQSANH